MAMVTMVDVARAAGVSTTTVSHVLNGTRPVSEVARHAVEAAIDATGYQPNTLARSLVTSRTSVLGLALSTVANPYFGTLIAAIEESARTAGYTILLADTGDEEEREKHVLGVLRRHRVDGILLATSLGSEAFRERSDSLLMGTPTVLVDRLVDGRFDQVGVENRESTRQLVAHLVSHGHKRIAFVSGRAELATTVERLDGYWQGLARAGIEPDPEIVVSGRSTSDGARQATHRLLHLRERPTALISGNNHMTLGVLRALTEAGVSVPSELAFAARDDTEWADLLPAPLTTLAQPIGMIGRTAVELLLARVATPELPPRTRRLEPTLNIRASCGCTP